MKLNKYIHAYMNHNRLHVIHELANYYFNRNNDSIITYDRLHVIHEIVIFISIEMKNLHNINM